MGTILSNAYERLFADKKMRLIMVGLDAAGKTTILYKLKLGEVLTQIPIIGICLEMVEFRDVSILAWDVGGCDRIRPLWLHYYKNVQGLIFVVDSCDRDRIDDACEGLKKLVNEELLREAVVLVFANKQDLPGAMTTEEITEKLNLCAIRGRNWIIQGCSAVKGDRLYEGLEWISTAICKG